MIFIKPKPIVIDFLTTTPTTPGVPTPASAGEHIPRWWRDIPVKTPAASGLHDLTTMRHCAGFLDYFHNSVAVPMWCDFSVEVGPSSEPYCRYQFADELSRADVHPQHQRGEFLPDTQYQQLKLMNRWYAKTARSFNWVLSQPTWCMRDPTEFIIPPGLLDFKYLHSLNANMFIPRHPDLAKQVLIPAGSALMFLTPTISGSVDLRVHTVSAADIDKIHTPRVYFTGDFLKRRHKGGPKGNT